MKVGGHVPVVTIKGDISGGDEDEVNTYLRQGLDSYE